MLFFLTFFFLHQSILGKKVPQFPQKKQNCFHWLILRNIFWASNQHSAFWKIMWHCNDAEYSYIWPNYMLWQIKFSLNIGRYCIIFLYFILSIWFLTLLPWHTIQSKGDELHHRFHTFSFSFSCLIPSNISRDCSARTVCLTAASN